MKNLIYKNIIFITLVSLHLIWLMNSSRYITPELSFPVWINSNSQKVTSEVLTLYPPTLIKILVYVNSYINSIELTINIVHSILIVSIDTILFLFLKKQINFKHAVVGLCFYIALQVFFRGTYLWYDLVTLPFVALSYIYFRKFILNVSYKDLFLSTLLLSMGYFFKNTVLWIFFLYFAFILFKKIFEKKTNLSFFTCIAALTIPLILSVILNLYLHIKNSTGNFAFHYYVVMQNFVYPRIDALPKPIESEYYYPLIILFLIYAFSFFFVKKYSSAPVNQIIFLFSLTLVSILNIFPRWGDFRLQIFIFFLSICLSLALYQKQRLKKEQKRNFTIFLISIIILFVPIFVVRINSDTKNRHKNTIFTSYDQNIASKVKNKKVFFHDFSLYNDLPDSKELDFKGLHDLKVAIFEPNKYYKNKNEEVAFNFITETSPDYVVIPSKVRKRILNNHNLTSTERLIIEKYEYSFRIEDVYYFYLRKN